MKRNKKLCCMLLSICMLSLTACGKDKEPVSADMFVEQMERAGLTVTDQTAEVMEGSGLSSAQVASLEGEYQIEFYQMDGEDHAKNIYNNAKDDLENQYETANGVAKTNVSMRNYAKFTITAEDRYFIVSRISDTMIYATATKENKDTVKDTVTGLGY